MDEKFGLLILLQVLKFNLTESGLFAVFPWLTMAFSANLGGWIADTLVSKGVSVTTVRKVSNIVIIVLFDIFTCSWKLYIFLGLMWTSLRHVQALFSLLEKNRSHCWWSKCFAYSDFMGYFSGELSQVFDFYLFIYFYCCVLQCTLFPTGRSAHNAAGLLNCLFEAAFKFPVPNQVTLESCILFGECS